jgi:hypothetical protein
VFYRGFSDFTEALEEYYNRIVKFQSGALAEWDKENQASQATSL